MSALTWGKRIGLLLLALVAVGLVTSLTLAAKPGGGGGGGGGGSVPPGRVSYAWFSEVGAGYVEFRGWWSMNADGSGKTMTAYHPTDVHHLSNQLHQGHRWYLERQQSTSGGNTRDVIAAVREDGNTDFSAVLLDAADLPDEPLLYICRWGQDDSFVSVAVARGTADGYVTEIWAAEVGFDPLTGLPAPTSQPGVVLSAEQVGFTDIESYDFSPSGDALVFQIDPGNGPTLIAVADLLMGEIRVLFNGANYPNWSPDGTRIAFGTTTNSGIQVINPDGTGYARLTNGGDTPAGFSPNGKFIVFGREFSKGSSAGTVYYSDVCRVPVAGGGVVNMTKDIDGYAGPSWWR